MHKRLSIRNIESALDVSKLTDMFSSVGEVRNATLETKSLRGTDYLIGYVEMSTEQEALDGIDRFHGQKRNGNTLIVTLDKPHVPIKTMPTKKLSGRAPAKPKAAPKKQFTLR